MESTLIIAIVAVLLGLMFLLGFMGLLAVIVTLMFRRRRAARPPKKEQAAAKSSGPPSTSERKLPKPPIAAAPSATPVPPPTLPRPPPPSPADPGLIGLFDDPRGNDSAKTELFQRGAAAYGFPDDDDDDPLDEGEATEIFSAHGAAGDLAEFAFDHETPGPSHKRK